MKEEKVQEIMKDVVKIWENTLGKEKIDTEKVKAVTEVLRESPHEDGLMPVTSTAKNGKTHLVPLKDIILKGLRGDELGKYPIKEEDSNPG